MSIAFATRSCGHRVPIGRPHCPYCHVPQLDAGPLRELVQARYGHVGAARVQFEVASRLGMEFGTAERQLNRIASGECRAVSVYTGDRLSLALGVEGPVLWGQAWDDASPVEPYGDEDF